MGRESPIESSNADRTAWLPPPPALPASKPGTSMPAVSLTPEPFIMGQPPAAAAPFSPAAFLKGQPAGGELSAMRTYRLNCRCCLCCCLCCCCWCCCWCPCCCFCCSGWFFRPLPLLEPGAPVLGAPPPSGVTLPPLSPSPLLLPALQPFLYLVCFCLLT